LPYFIRRSRQLYRSILVVLAVSVAFISNGYASVMDEYEKVHKIQLEAEAIILGAAFHQRRVMETDKLVSLRNLVYEFANESRLFAEARLVNSGTGDCAGWANHYLHESLPILSRELKKGEDHWRLLFDRTAEEVVNDTFYEFGGAIDYCLED
jgi:hypothetical protein